MSEEVKPSGFWSIATYARGGWSAFLLALAMTMWVPALAVHIADDRSARHAAHGLARPLTWIEAATLLMAVIVALACSVLGGAQLKAWVRQGRTSWRPAATEGLIFLLLLLATLLLRAFAQGVGDLPASVGGPLIAAMTVWVFLMGYLAKIPWDRLVEIVGERMTSSGADPARQD